MKSAKDYLSKFRDLKPPDDALKKALVNALRSVAGVSATAKDVSIARGVAFVRVSSVAKNALRLVRGKILEELYRDVPKARELVRDIR